MNRDSRAKFPRVLRRLVAGAFLGAALMLVGCHNENVTTENFRRLYEGMPMEEVEAILGEPSKKDGDDFYYKGKYFIIVVEVGEDGAVEDIDQKDLDD
jgi:hypothetical protein